jgi:2-haloalkanoic acid dehalogenase type II
MAVRHARHEFPMTIKAVVFDAYGTLYDIQSVAAVTEEAFPGYGEIITQIWRFKQLEYTWLRSLMRRYQDFSVVTRDSLVYTLRCLGLESDTDAFESIIDKYLHLDLYPDAMATLAALRDRRLAILSNGSTGMLNALVRNSGLDRVLDATISVDSQKIFKACSGGLPPDRIDAAGAARRGAVRVLEPLGRLRRQGVRAERRLDRTGDAGGDGAGVCQKRRRRPAHNVQGDPHPDGRTVHLSPTIASTRCRNCPIWSPP